MQRGFNSYSFPSSREPDDVLRQLPLFRSVATRSGFINLLSDSLQRRTFRSGDFVFRAGDEGAEMFLILTGKVELFRRDGSILTTLKSGDHFGEIAMLYGGTRNASAKTCEITELAILSKGSFQNAASRYNVREQVMASAQDIPYVKQWFITRVPLFNPVLVVPRFIDKVANVFRYKAFTQGQTIVRAGETGDDMFFIVGGSVDVFAQDGTRINTLEEGEYFGEISLLYGGQRAATVQANSYVHTYSLAKQNFEDVLDEFPECVDPIFGSAQETQYLKIALIKKIPLFQGAAAADPEFVHNLAAALHNQSFERGQYLIRQGERGTEMYVMARGDVEVIKDGNRVAELHSGDFFGELSLLYDDKRSASIRAIQYCHCYVLTQEAFETIAVAFPEWLESMLQNNLLFKRVEQPGPPLPPPPAPITSNNPNPSPRQRSSGPSSHRHESSSSSRPSSTRNTTTTTNSNSGGPSGSRSNSTTLNNIQEYYSRSNAQTHRSPLNNRLPSARRSGGGSNSGSVNSSLSSLSTGSPSSSSVGPTTTTNSNNNPRNEVALAEAFAVGTEPPAVTSFQELHHVPMPRTAEEERRSRLSLSGNTTEDQLQDLLDEKKCILCCDEEKCMLIIPCGHVSTCEECTAKLTDNKCPQCRKNIQQTIKAHF